jgi:hypothetical protein
VYKFTIFLKMTYGQILLMTLCVFTPYLIIRSEMPSIPYMLYFYLIVLAAIKYIIINDQKFRKQCRTVIENLSVKKTGKMPSQNEIVKTTENILFQRDLIFIGFAMLGLMVNIIL